MIKPEEKPDKGQGKKDLGISAAREDLPDFLVGKIPD
jgi:hypothetical protein